MRRPMSTVRGKADISVGFSTHVAEMIPARLAVLTINNLVSFLSGGLYLHDTKNALCCGVNLLMSVSFNFVLAPKLLQMICQQRPTDNADHPEVTGLKEEVTI